MHLRKIYISSVFIAFAASHPRVRGESSTTCDKRTTWLFDITRLVAGSSCKIFSRFIEKFHVSSGMWVSGKIEIIPERGDPGCRGSCERSSLISRNFLEYECTGRFIILPGDVYPLVCTVGVLPRIFGAISARQNAHGMPRTVVDEEDAARSCACACTHTRADTQVHSGKRKFTSQ